MALITISGDIGFGLVNDDEFSGGFLVVLIFVVDKIFGGVG